MTTIEAAHHINEGYRCQQFPANHIWADFRASYCANAHRSRSVEKSKRLGLTPDTRERARRHRQAVENDDEELLED